MIRNAHIVCFSGGESSALVAIEVYRKFGKDSLILLNHDIIGRSESPDIKRFKNEIAGYVGVPVTYANMNEWHTKDQFDVVVEAGAFKVKNGTALCTNRMKTEPFHKWLSDNDVDETSVLYYGFDLKEPKRIQRRSQLLGIAGYRTEFPLATWKRTIRTTSAIGIEPPDVYGEFQHANCVGCLKAGMKHWYVVYCTRPDIWERGLWAEEEIGYTIIKGYSLFELESKFETMRRAGVPAVEGNKHFWKIANKLVALQKDEEDALPCECLN